MHIPELLKRLVSRSTTWQPEFHSPHEWNLILVAWVCSCEKSVKRPASPEDDYSDLDAEAESDKDYDNRRYKRHSPSPAKDEPIAELNDVQHIRIGRENFAQVCFYPLALPPSYMCNWTTM